VKAAALQIRRWGVLFLLAMELLLLPSCALWRNWVEGRQALRELAWVETARPEQDLMSAVLRNDFRLLAVHGRDEIPGIGKEEAGFVERYGVRHLAGTSAVPHGFRHRRLDGAARKYAARYNKLLLLYLKRGSV
jgi:hypothetical protein